MSEQQTAEGAEVIDRGAWDRNRDPKMVANPFEQWSHLREQSRAFTSSVDPQWTTWVLMHHDDVLSAFQHTELFSNRGIAARNPPRYHDDPRPADEIVLIPEGLDPPEHLKYRALLASRFGPARIRQMEASIRSWCGELIEGFRPHGRCEVNLEFARQFPATIFLRLMGLPEGGVGEFLNQINRLYATPVDERENDRSAQKLILAYLSRVVEERRKSPQDDITSYLLSVELDGQKLTDAELTNISYLLYLAGLDTVAGVLGLTIMRLAQHPDERHRLMNEPEMIPAFIEEVLRFYPIVNPPRIVTQDVEFAGCPMRRGDRITLGVTAAGRDPKEFDRADVFDMDRPTNRHITFGAGPHRCLGSHLARLELRIAVEEWLARIPDFHVEGDIVFKQGLYGVNRLVVAWSQPAA